MHLATQYNVMDFPTIYILVIIFIATLVRSTFGFGESLVAVPLLILVIPVEIAVPLSVLLSIFVAAIVVIQDRKKVDFDSAKFLIFFAILGIPVGLLLLLYADENLIKSVLGILIVLFSLYSLGNKKQFIPRKGNMMLLFICGFLSGVFGGAYGLNGPPLVIYGKIKDWSPTYFRATLQAYFLPVSIIGMFGYWYKGLWNSTVTYYFLLSLPLVIPAIFLGRYFNKHLGKQDFLKFVYMGLIAIGMLLIMQTII